MWGRKPNAEPNEGTPAQPYTQPETPRRTEPATPSRPAAAVPPRQRNFDTPAARVGTKLQFNGEVSGSEDLQVDGDFKGKVDLKDNCLTIGPNARVEADVHARAICIYGRLKGNVEAPERIELRKTGSLEGDVVTAGIVIEEGAIFRGSIDIIRPEAKAQESPVKKSRGTPAPAKPIATPMSAREKPDQKSAATG